MEAYQTLELMYQDWLERVIGKKWYCVACNSGTAALHLALEALRLPQGLSQVLVPEFTMVACARAVSLARLSPTFIDCGDDLLLDPELLDKVPKHVRAVMPVHIYGRRCNMERISAWAVHRHAYIVEDLAEAHGIAPHPNTAAACWSFYKNKIVHGEEGGMVAFQNPVHAITARAMRSLGFTQVHDFQHVPHGMNYRLANLLANPIIDSFMEIEPHLTQRQRVISYYDLAIPQEWRMPARQVGWVYDVRIPLMKKAEQDKLVYTMNAQGIAARHAFRPMSSQPEYRAEFHHLNAYRLSHEVVYFPLMDGNRPLTQPEVQRIVAQAVALAPSPRLLRSQTLRLGAAHGPA